VKKIKQQLKEMFATPQGWLSWLIANVITSSFWFMPLIFAFILNDKKLYTVSASIWAFMMLPVTPFWILNVVIAVWFKNLLLKRKSVIINKGE
jgi:hypothetical protein